MKIIDIPGGCTIMEAAEKMVKLADKRFEWVAARFNDIYLEVHPGDEANRIVFFYFRMMEVQWDLEWIELEKERIKAEKRKKSCTTKI